MSADDKERACPSEHQVSLETFEEPKDFCGDEVSEKKKKQCYRKVSFPDDDLIVTQYFEPANPWHDGKLTILACIQHLYFSTLGRLFMPIRF